MQAVQFADQSINNQSINLYRNTIQTLDWTTRKDKASANRCP